QNVLSSLATGVPPKTATLGGAARPRRRRWRIGDFAGTSLHHRINRKGQHVRPRAADDGLKLGCKELHMTETLQRTRQRHAQEIAIAEDSGRRGARRRRWSRRPPRR